MTDSHSLGHGASGSATGQTHFPDAEWNGFRNDDLDAARHIIYLMVGIFTMGLVLYAVVCYFVVS